MDAEMRGLVGAIAGLGIGIVDYAIFTRLFERIRIHGKQSPDVLRLLGWVAGFSCFVLLPVAGYAIGRFVWI